MNKQKQTVLLLIGTLHSSIEYIDLVLEVKIFSYDLKFAAKNLLSKIEKWFAHYYKLNKEEVEEVATQIELLATLYEKSASIAFQLNEYGDVVADNFMNEFEGLIAKYKIKL